MMAVPVILIALVLLAVAIGIAAFVLPLAAWMFAIALAILPIAFTIWAIVSCATSNKATNTKILWIIVIVLAPFLGPLLWFLWGKNNT